MSKDPAAVERWCILEQVFQGPREGQGPQEGNPYTDVWLSAELTGNSRVLQVPGFYDGNGRYKIRFMPDLLGQWHYRTASNRPELDGLEGDFVCTPAAAGNRGPVRVRRTYHFAYEDGTPYYPFGTTCYAWQHQGDALEEQTLQTLSASPFNKMRMCVFPKHYDFNANEPAFYPFPGSLADGWDFTRFNPGFFRHLEQRVQNLLDLGIEADLILFHPYDRWGFASMDAATDERYLRYLAARLSCYRNVWWSFANEYDLMKSKSLADWEHVADVLVASDPWQHLRSIHNWHNFYDYTRPWVTHCSIQKTDPYKSSEWVNEWRDRYRKPVVVDECAYEGNISHNWGNLTAQEMVRRFWEGAVRGGYVGHGEAYMHPQEILWWSKGGVLHGQSPERIAFLRKIVEEGPAEGLDYAPAGSGGERNLPCGGQPDSYYLHYFGFFQPTCKTFLMTPGIPYHVDVIDTWNMTIETQTETREGTFRVDLPGRPYMAVRLRRG